MHLDISYVKCIKYFNMFLNKYPMNSHFIRVFLGLLMTLEKQKQSRKSRNRGGQRGRASVQLGKRCPQQGGPASRAWPDAVRRRGSAAPWTVLCSEDSHFPQSTTLGLFH